MDAATTTPRSSARAVYPLLNSVIVPRPIAWVSTRSAEGVDNLAPHSFFTVSSVQPAGRAVHLRRAQGLAAQRPAPPGEFVVCIATEELAEQVNTTATDYPADVSEFDQAGRDPRAERRVAPYRVAESPVAIECRLLDTYEFGGGDTVVFGEVVHLSIAESVLRDERPAIDLLRPVARLGALEWAPSAT
jgi:flavin reductase (DIM6/NTAB) family NADH-FMN oxidoreductase RutF